MAIRVAIELGIHAAMAENSITTKGGRWRDVCSGIAIF